MVARSASSWATLTCCVRGRPYMSAADTPLHDAWRGACDVHKRDHHGDQGKPGESLPEEQHSRKTRDTLAPHAQPSSSMGCTGRSGARPELPADPSREALLGPAAEDIGGGEMVLDAGGAGAVGEVIVVEGVGGEVAEAVGGMRHRELPPVLEATPADACPFPGASLPLHMEGFVSADSVVMGSSYAPALGGVVLGHPSLAEAHGDRGQGEGDDDLVAEHPPPLDDE